MNWPPKRDSEADVSSVSPSSERIILCLFTETVLKGKIRIDKVDMTRQVSICISVECIRNAKSAEKLKIFLKQVLQFGNLNLEFSAVS